MKKNEKIKYGLCLLVLAFFPLAVLADGIIIIDRPSLSEPVHPSYLDIKYHHVEVRMDNQHAATKVDQVFINNSSRELEGTYLFPIPRNASISDFSMHIDNEEVKGEVVDRDRARQIYENYVRQQIDPALLEYVGQGAFRASVFPIPARGEKRIGLGYEEVLTKDNDIFKYVYPLSTEKFSPKNLDEVKIEVAIKSAEPIKNIYSPSHNISITRIDDYNASVSYFESNTKPKQDFTLYYGVSSEDIGLNFVAYREAGSASGFFMMMASPKVVLEEKEILGKDLVCIIDRSGSMAGVKVKQAKDSLKYIINNLNGKDAFNIITFSDSIDSLSSSLLPASSSNVSRALEYVDEIKASGATNINDALLKGIEMLARTDNSSSKIIIFLTDGRPTYKETNISRILENTAKENKNARIFVFGVGNEVNTHLLDQLAEQNNAVSAYVAEKEDIEAKVSSLYDKISHPVLSGVRALYPEGSVSELFPKNLPDMFKGSQLIVVGKYQAAGPQEITLTGRSGSKTVTYNYQIQMPLQSEENSFLPRLWATKKIGYLLDQIRLEGESEEAKQQIISLATQYGIATPYTSFLVDLDIPINELGKTEVMREASDRMVDSFKQLDLGGSFGASAVQNAEELNMMKQSGNYIPEDERVKNVASKPFFRQNDYWVDPDFSADNAVEVAYGSEDYFKLLDQYPGINQFLAVGQQAKFNYRGVNFAISHSGSQASADGDGNVDQPPSISGKTEKPENRNNFSALMVGAAVMIIMIMIVAGLISLKKKVDRRQ